MLADVDGDAIEPNDCCSIIELPVALAFDVVTSPPNVDVPVPKNS